MVSVAPRVSTRSDADTGTSLVAVGLARLAVACATTTIGLAAAGALAVRPIADDLVVNAKLTQFHGPLPAFGSWMTSWTGYYSEYGILTALASVTRALGIDRFTFAIASIALLALMVACVRRCVVTSRRLEVTGWGWPETIILTAGLLGSFIGPLQESRHANVYEAIYWASAWMSHLVPVLACPLVIIGVVGIGNRSRRTAAAFVSGVFVAGFGLAETVVVVAIVCASAWVTRRLRGREMSSRYHRTLAAAIVGLVAGTVLVARLPGTIARARFFQSAHLGLAAHRGLANLVRASATIGWTDAKAVVLSPAPVLGIFIGLALFLTPLGRTRAKLDSALPDLLAASWTVVVVSWVAVTFGDVSATQASWHLLPLIVVLYTACVLTGYALGTRSEARLLPVGVGVCLVAAFSWTTMQTKVAADVAFTRASLFDDNVRSAQIAVRHTPPRPTIWYSMSVGSMTDATSGPYAFVATAVQQWLRIDPKNFVIVPIAAPDR